MIHTGLIHDYSCVFLGGWHWDEQFGSSNKNDLQIGFILMCFTPSLSGFTWNDFGICFKVLFGLHPRNCDWLMPMWYPMEYMGEFNRLWPLQSLTCQMAQCCHLPPPKPKPVHSSPIRWMDPVIANTIRIGTPYVINSGFIHPCSSCVDIPVFFRKWNNSPLFPSAMI